MKIEIKPADVVTEAANLIALDARMFLPSDRFDDPGDWQEYIAFWIVVDGQVVGSIAFGLNVEFSGSWDIDKSNPGSLYIASTGILPEFQQKGIGNIVKQWEIDWAKSHGFKRISTNCRASNQGSLRLNAKFGFKVISEIPHYYEDPDEPAIVMKLEL